MTIKPAAKVSRKAPSPPSPAVAPRPWEALLRPISSVTPYEGNPRRNEAGVAKVARSIAEFGWQQPIVVDEEGVVLAGHTRLLAAQSLGLAEVPVRVARGLTPAQARAYRLADNRSAQDSTWDETLLTTELQFLGLEGYDLSLTGFNPDEITGLLNPNGGILPGVDPDDIPEPPATPITKPGDLILLGKHRLVCGDSADAMVWDALLAGRQVGMIWTDPPYGVSYVGKTKDALTIENDDLAEGGLEDFLRGVFALGLVNTRPGGAWYVAAPAGPLHLAFCRVLHECGTWRQTLVWLKDQFVMGRSDYHYRNEPIFYGWKEGAAHTWNGGRAQDTVLEIPRPRASKEHPTMKPVALVQRCIENSSNPDDLVVDPFGGSGTTMLASEASGRTSALIELDPRYCDVICQRWSQATGQQAVRP